jgi:DNA-binding NarL/FixJ family response regulator
MSTHHAVGTQFVLAGLLPLGNNRKADRKPFYKTQISEPATPLSARLYRIVVADEFPVMRRGLRTLLSTRADTTIVAEAVNGPDILGLAKKECPDLIIMGLTMPGTSEYQTIRSVSDTCPKTKLLIFSARCTEESLRMALAAGADGYVLKSDPEANLMLAIDKMKRNEPYFAPEALKHITKAFVSASAAENIGLTEREVAIVREIARGASNKEVAFNLHLSIRTVETHRYRIMQKLKITSYSELIRFAIRRGLVEP